MALVAPMAAMALLPRHAVTPKRLNRAMHNLCMPPHGLVQRMCKPHPVCQAQQMQHRIQGSHGASGPQLQG